MEIKTKKVEDLREAAKWLKSELKSSLKELEENKNRLFQDYLTNFSWVGEAVLIKEIVVKHLTSRLTLISEEHNNYETFDMETSLKKEVERLTTKILSSVEGLNGSSNPGHRFVEIAELKAFKEVINIYQECLSILK